MDTPRRTSLRLARKHTGARVPRTIDVLHHDVIDLLLPYLDGHAHRCFAFVLRGCKALSHVVTPALLRPPYACNNVCSCLLPRSAHRSYEQRLTAAMLHDHAACVARTADPDLPCSEEMLIAVMRAGKRRWVDFVLAHMRSHFVGQRSQPHLMNVRLLHEALTSGMFAHVRHEFAVPHDPIVGYDLRSALAWMPDDDLAVCKFLVQHCNDHHLPASDIPSIMRSIGAHTCLAYYGDGTVPPLDDHSLSQCVSRGLYEQLSVAEQTRVTDDMLVFALSLAIHRADIGSVDAVLQRMSHIADIVTESIVCTGPLHILQHLLDRGMSLPPNALRCALRGAPLNVIQFLMDKGHVCTPELLQIAVRECKPVVVAYLLDRCGPIVPPAVLTRNALRNIPVLRMLLATKRSTVTRGAVIATMKTTAVDAMLAFIEYGFPRTPAAFRYWLTTFPRNAEMLAVLLQAGYPIPPNALALYERETARCGLPYPVHWQRVVVLLRCAKLGDATGQTASHARSK